MLDLFLLHVRKGNFAGVQKMVEDMPECVLLSNDQDITGLMLAIEHGHSDIAKYLVEHGANINATNRIGVTSLMIAAKEDNLDMVQYLLEQPEIKVDMADIENYTALTYASVSDFANAYKLIECLASHHANVNLRDADGISMIDKAVQNNNIMSVKTLLSYGAKLEASNLEGNELFDTQNPEILMQLIEHGIDMHSVRDEQTVEEHLSRIKDLYRYENTSNERTETCDAFVKIKNYLDNEYFGMGEYLNEKDPHVICALRRKFLDNHKFTKDTSVEEYEQQLNNATFIKDYYDNTISDELIQYGVQQSQAFYDTHH